MESLTDKEILKEILLTKCKEYYSIEGNVPQGNLHLVLEDNNSDYNCVKLCRHICVLNKDFPGYEICILLMHLTDDERETFINKNYENYSLR